MRFRLCHDCIVSTWFWRKLWFVCNPILNQNCCNIFAVATLTSNFEFDVLDEYFQVDAIAIEVNGPDEKKDLEMIGKPFTCAEGGISMFTLKSNTFVQWWNPAFKTLVKSGQYHKLCKKVKNGKFGTNKQFHVSWNILMAYKDKRILGISRWMSQSM